MTSELAWLLNDVKTNQQPSLSESGLRQEMKSDAHGCHGNSTEVPVTWVLAH